MCDYKFHNAEVEKTFLAYPKKVRDKLLFLRKLVFQVAEQTEHVGELQETLKWESPSYITVNPKVGTTIRLAPITSQADKVAISVHCQSTLIAEFKEIYPELEYDKNRSIIFDINTEFPSHIICHFISLALTYHYRKKHKLGV